MDGRVFHFDPPRDSRGAFLCHSPNAAGRVLISIRYVVIGLGVAFLFLGYLSEAIVHTGGVPGPYVELSVATVWREIGAFLFRPSQWHGLLVVVSLWDITFLAFLILANRRIGAKRKFVMPAYRIVLGAVAVLSGLLFIGAVASLGIGPVILFAGSIDADSLADGDLVSIGRCLLSLGVLWTIGFWRRAERSAEAGSAAATT